MLVNDFGCIHNPRISKMTCNDSQPRSRFGKFIKVQRMRMPQTAIPACCITSMKQNGDFFFFTVVVYLVEDMVIRVNMLVAKKYLEALYCIGISDLQSCFY